MSDTKETGDAAFPFWDMTFNSEPDLFSAGTSQGMTLRDHFAGLAMQGTLANEARLAIIMKADGLPSDALEMQDRLARRCYSMADMMLKAREQ
jgi:hypothetical protein